MNAITNLSPNLSRRNFLGVSGVFVLGACLPSCARTPRPPVATEPFVPNLFLALEPDGTVHVTAHRSEMGQGIRTALAQVVADELDADWSRVVVDQADGDAKYGDQNTDGSRSILLNYERLRTAGAAARLMLRQAAAQHWGVGVDEVEATNHEVIHAGSGQRLGYGDLAGIAATLPVPEDPPRKSEAEHRYIGKHAVHVDAADIVRGKGTYGADFQMPNMATAVVVRCPWLGGGVKNILNKPNTAPGLVAIEILDPSASAGPVFNPVGGVAVVAEDTYSAMRIARELEIEWTDSPNKTFSSDALQEELRDALTKPGHSRPQLGKGRRRRGLRGPRHDRDLRHLRNTVPSACPDGTAGGHRGRIRGHVHGPRTVPGSAVRPRLSRGLARLRTGERDGHADVARRRLRAQVEAGLRARGRRTLQAPRPPDPRAMVARGRHPPRLLPCVERAIPPCGDR